jgi:rod shape-determining protein MreC
VIGFVVVLVILTSFQLPIASRARDFLAEGFVPFLELWSRIRARSTFLVDRVKAYSELQVENTLLKKDLGELKARVAQISDLERENRDLRAMLDFKDRSELKLLSAKVIGRDPSLWWNTVLVDRGEADGITRDMPVLTVQGLVGKTIKVQENSAQVLLIVDENCKVSGWLPDSAQYGIVHGNILAGGTGSQCRMTFLDQQAELKAQETVVTSGLGGIFPKGITIGTISALVPSQGHLLYQEAQITPAVDLARIDEVFIGIGTKPVPPPPPKKPSKAEVKPASKKPAASVPKPKEGAQ